MATAAGRRLQEMARAALCLASDASSFMTGSDLRRPCGVAV
jgi:hypothetical protein